jgi:Xaa-Pro dipeptidase
MTMSRAFSFSSTGRRSACAPSLERPGERVGERLARRSARPLGRGLRACLRGLAVGLALAGVLALGGARAAAQVRMEDGGRFHLDVESIQGVLEIQQTGGWLLYDHDGLNPVALAVARPTGGRALHRWFYLVPARGQPTLLSHRADAARFAHLPGRRIEYTDPDSFTRGVKSMLRGVKDVVMEYSPMAALPDLSRVDAGTVELVRKQRVKVRSSAELVQLTKSLWRPEQRISHYVAVHHLDQLRQAALAFVAERVGQGQRVTERDVQQFLLRGYDVRGLVGPAPIVATTAHAADPVYTTSPLGGGLIQPGDLLLIDMAGRVAGDDRAVFARIAWMAYVGNEVPQQLQTAFAALVQAREAAVRLIEDRAQQHRVVKGYEVDEEARTVLQRAGHAADVRHRTGHSLDVDLHGGGANLDGLGTRDTRALLVGAGLAVAPGLYKADELGMRTAVNVYIGPGTVEVTTPAQTEITALAVP